MADHSSSFSERATMDIDDASEQLAASTPPTSVGDDNSSTHENASIGGRAKRSRVSINYNVKELLNAQAAQEVTRATTSKPRKASGLSGRTLVNPRSESPPDELENEDINMELEDDLEKMLARSPQGKGKSKSTVKPKKPERRPSLMGRAKNAASVLGKRTRDVYEAGKKKLGMVDEENAPKKSKLLRELDTGKGGLLDELDFDAIPEPQPQPPPAKRARTSTKTTKAAPKAVAPASIASDEMQKTSSGVMLKKWQSQGLFAGQPADFDPTKSSKKSKLQKKNADSSDSTDTAAQPTRKHLNIGLPMFGYLDRERSFTIPYDIYGPHMDKEMAKKPPKYTTLNKNKPVGDARDLYKPLKFDAVSYCTCRAETGCDEDCWNRIMQFECDKSNCKLEPDQCGNRPFYELQMRAKRNTPFDIGVEVIKTEKRGHGVRAARWFDPGQIIMEYTGEVITEEECQTRMATVYTNAPCYYVMEMEGNLILDGMKGSIARFINHSCNPNCEVRMTRVAHVLRIGVYAGKQGIMTGEELSYDYNFQNFNDQHKQACYCGGQQCRGYLGKKFTESEMKKLTIETQMKLRTMAEEAQQRAEVEAAKKQAQIDRGPTWRGYVLVDEVREELAEKARKKKEAEENSDRARRIAQRRSGGPAAIPASQPSRKKAVPRRKKSVIAEEETPAQDTTMPAEDDDDESDEDLKVEVVKNISRSKLKRSRDSTADDVDSEDRPASKTSSPPSSRNSGITKETVVSVKQSTEAQQNEEQDTVSEIIVSARTSLAKASSSGDTTQATEGAAENEAPKAGKSTMPKRSQSMRDRVKQAISSVSSGGMKTLKQSTLNFAKRS